MQTDYMRAFYRTIQTPDYQLGDKEEFSHIEPHQRKCLATKDGTIHDFITDPNKDIFGIKKKEIKKITIN